MTADQPADEHSTAEDDLLERVRRIRSEVEQRNAQAEAMRQREVAERQRQWQVAEAQRQQEEAAAQRRQEEARSRLPRPHPEASAPGSSVVTTGTSSGGSSGSDAAPVRASAASRYPCPWCGKTVELGRSESQATCRACGHLCALGQCPHCRRVAFSRADGDRVVCSLCSKPSHAHPRNGDRLAGVGAQVAKAGCALTALVWILIPVGLLLLLAMWALIGRK